MYKLPLLFPCLFFYLFSADAQAPRLYKDLVFADVTIDQNLSYAPDDKSEDKRSHLFDLYQPKGDQSLARPLVIWMHGGGFKFGSKDAQDIRLWSRDFARRGYVCAAINYTLGKKTASFNFEQLQKSCFYAVQDAKLAVEYFRRHHREYNINPDKIILAGNSAGGMIAMQAAYSSDAELAKMAGITGTPGNEKDRLKVAAVINFWGGIFDLGWLKNASVPIVCVVGDRDRIMSPTHTTGALYGGVDIHREADSLHIPNDLKIFEGYGHQLQKHFNPIFPAGRPTQKRWLEASQFAAGFLYKSILN